MADEKTVPEETEQTIPFFPDHVLTEFWVAVGVVIILVIIAVAGTISPVGLGDPADPMNTPLHVKPEWYFLFLYQILKFVSKTVGALLPFVLLFILIFWPFFDSKPDSRRARLIRIIIAVAGIIAVVGLTIWGEVS